MRSSIKQAYHSVLKPSVRPRYSDDRDYTDGEDDEDTEEQENSSEWEPETPANEQGRGTLDFEGHVCHGDHSACHHNVGVPFPR